jgi:hypothetical protein
MPRPRRPVPPAPDRMKRGSDPRHGGEPALDRRRAHPAVMSTVFFFPGPEQRQALTLLTGLCFEEESPSPQ